MPIMYNYSGDEADNHVLFRRFRLDELLRYTADYSADIFSNPSLSPGHGASFVEYSVINATTRKSETHEVAIMAWDLIDLAYYAILHTNDYRGKEIESIEEFCVLCSAIRSSIEKRESEFLEKADGTKLLLYFWMFSGEQFKFQSLNKCLESFSRDLYLLYRIAPRIDGISEIHNIVQKETGTNWNTIATSLLITWCGSIQKQDITSIKNYIEWDNNLPVEAFERTIERYTATYAEVKSSGLQRQFFYTKPFVMTERSHRLFCINCYLGLFLLEHCITWIVRDYYNAKNDRRFTSEFGSVFEQYLLELLTEYLPQGSYEKIPEASSERADWRIDTGDYCFLIEQKSAFLALGAKQQDTDINQLVEYVKKNIFKAMKQLQTTETELCGARCIKIILLYEDYIDPDALDELTKLPECLVPNDRYYWLVTIREMEMLLSLYKENPTLFEEIISEKIKREESQYQNGKSIQKIMSERGIYQNQHIVRPQIKYYRDAIIENAKAHLNSGLI